MEFCNYCQNQLINYELQTCKKCKAILQYKYEKQAKPYWDAGASYHPEITINAKNGFFREKDLQIHGIKYLIEEYVYFSYIRYKAVGLKGGRETAYLLMPRFNESIIHFFYCKIIEEFLRNFTSKVWLYVTVRPDIVFEAGGQKFAVEVETGSGAEHPKRLRAKIRQLKKEFGERWFFVVTSYKLKEKYKKFGKTFLKREVAGELGRIFGKNSK